MSSMMVSWLAITSRELNWMLTILSSSSSSRVGQAGDTSITSILMRAAGSRMSVMAAGLPTLRESGGEETEAAGSSEDRALVRSAWEGGVGAEAGTGEPRRPFVLEPPERLDHAFANGALQKDDARAHYYVDDPRFSP